MFKKIRPRVPDVVLVESGKTADGKPMFNVENIASIPPVIEGKKGAKRNLPPIIADEFGILRPVKIWRDTVYEKLGFGYGREKGN